MTMRPYDDTRDSLLHPGKADDFLELGRYDTDAKLCADMSRLAYVKEVHRLRFYLEQARFELKAIVGYPPENATPHEVQQNRGTQAFVAVHKDQAFVVIAFRGTEPDDPSDLFADAKFVQTDWRGASGQPMGQVHLGFAEASKDANCFEHIKAAADALPAGHRVLVTGHSLGAALATLMASWLPSAHLYTFGSPRVGDAAFVDAMKNPVMQRFVDCRDIVTRVPPENLPGLAYKHVGMLQYMDRHGKLLGNASDAIIDADRWQAAVDYLPRVLLWGTAPSRDLADHAPINYVSAVMGLRG